MQVTERAPFGIEIAGFDLAGIDDGIRGAIVELLGRHSVAVIRDQPVDDAAFAAFLAALGPPMFTQGETPVPDHPTLNVVSNVGRDRPPRSVFHTDTSYVARPPAFTALRPVRLPTAGGATLFADMYAAYERLEADQATRLQGVTVRHGVTGVDDTGGQGRVARHPLLRRHPVSGRVAVFLSTPERCGDLDGVSPAESTRIVAHLYEEATDPGRVLSHDWRAGDVLIWDDRCTMHKADHEGVEGERVLHRGMVEGEVPIAA